MVGCKGNMPMPPTDLASRYASPQARRGAIQAAPSQRQVSDCKGCGAPLEPVIHGKPARACSYCRRPFRLVATG